MSSEDIDAKEQKSNKNIRGMADLIVAKQRNGPTDNVELVFRKEYTRFTTVAKDYEQAYADDLGGHAEMVDFT